MGKSKGLAEVETPGGGLPFGKETIKEIRKIYMIYLRVNEWK